MKRRRRSREQWSRLCEEFAASGETVAVFARRRRLNPARLQWWQSRFRREGGVARARGGFVEVVTSSEPEPAREVMGGRTVVRIGEAVSVEFVDHIPPVPWVVELAGRC